MNKKVLQLAAVLVVLVGLVAAVLWLQRDAETADESSQEPAVVVAGGDPAVPVRRLHIENQTGSFTIRNDAPATAEDGTTPKPEYHIEGAEGLPVNQSLLAGAANAAASLVAKSVVGNGDFATYGLDKPRATVSAEYAQASTVVLVGNEAPGGEGVYVATDRDDTVYVVQGTSVSHFLKSKLEFMDTVVTKGSAEATGFTSFTLSGSAFEEPIVIQATPDEAKDVSGVSLDTHSIVQPVQAGLDGQKGLSVLQSVFGLTADAVVADNQDEQTLAEFGLAEPVAVAEVVSDDEEVGRFTLTAGTPDADGNVYVLRSGSPLVYRFSQAALPWMSTSVFELMERMVVTPYINTVSSLTVDTPERSYTFVLSGEDDELQVKLDGKELEAKNFRQFYQTVLFASYHETTEETPSGEPILRFTYNYRTDEKAPDVISFYKGPVRRAFIVHNDGTPYFTQSIYVDRVLEDVVKLANGEEVEPYL